MLSQPSQLFFGMQLDSDCVRHSVNATSTRNESRSRALWALLLLPLPSSYEG